MCVYVGMQSVVHLIIRIEMLYLILVEVFLLVEATTSIERQCSAVVDDSCPEGFSDEIDGYCYKLVRSTYPYECPYKNAISSYDLIYHFPDFEDAIWINARRNPDYGYYVCTDEGDYYGQLLNSGKLEPQSTLHDCVVLKESLYSTVDCNELNVGICMYDRYDLQFCDSLSSICDYNPCCREGHYKFMCQDQCDDTCSAMCTTCQERFDTYPEPTIDIKVEGAGRESKIIVTIKNRQKLLYMQSDYVTCFADTQSKIYGLFYKPTSVFTIVEDNDDSYIISFATGFIGHYWCHAYKYPNLEEVTSNTIVAGATGGDNLYVVNCTVEIIDAAMYLTYTMSNEIIDMIDKNSDLMLSRVFSWDRKRSYVTLVFHYITDESYDDALNSIEALPSGVYTGFKIINVSFGLPETCAQHNITVNGVILEWPDAHLGQSVPARTDYVKYDGLPVMRTCLGSFLYGSYWSEVAEVAELLPGSEWTIVLFDLLYSNSTSEESNRSLQEILDGIEIADAIIEYDVYLIAKILEMIVQRGENFTVDIFAENVNRIMAFDEATLASAQFHLNATDIVLYNLDLALGILADDEEHSSVIITERILAQVTNVNATGINGVAIYDVAGELQLTSLMGVTNISDLNLTNLVFASFIPPKLLHQIHEYLPYGSNATLIMAVFTNDALFNDRGIEGSNSYVLSVFVPNFRSSLLNESVPIISRSTGYDSGCAYWNYGTDDLRIAIYGHWASGPNVTYFNGYKQCNFEHMTHFAFLMGAPADEALNVISTIGCALSMSGVAGIAITAASFRNWRDQAATKLLLNFSASIFVQMAALFITEFIDANKNAVICTVVAFTLHYTIVSQFCWMLIISYLQYRRIVRSFAETKNLLAKSCVFAWLTPMLPILIFACVDINYYRNANCHVSSAGLIYGLLAPIGVAVSINLILFASILYSLTKSKTRAFGQNEKMIVEKVRLVIVLFFLMGFSWIFGLLARFLGSLVLSYLFCLTATSQGFVMFVYFVLCNNMTRRSWMKWLGCNKCFLTDSNVTDKTF